MVKQTKAEKEKEPEGARVGLVAGATGKYLAAALHSTAPTPMPSTDSVFCFSIRGQAGPEAISEERPVPVR